MVMLIKISLNDSIFSLLIEGASLAPGRMQGDDEKYDVSLNLKYKGLTFDGRYVDRERDLAFTNVWRLEY